MIEAFIGYTFRLRLAPLRGAAQSPASVN